MIDYNMHSFMIVCAFRYCLGRKTYAVSMCVSYIMHHWNCLDKIDKDIIIKEIILAIQENRIGHECDKTEWLKILDYANK